MPHSSRDNLAVSSKQNIIKKLGTVFWKMPLSKPCESQSMYVRTHGFVFMWDFNNLDYLISQPIAY